ncbi:hypothetical protein [Corynebacterium sp. UMB4614]|uniref:hypothetical protein n=1 Tax=Corynebacterium sp. UMB4614 TaxID=3046334 RepID=UPI0025511A2C|nr:hypothetical protein [Corynebacterium sp. UMB4614]MDK7134827.1 hypothetical protein [Corynebacterium sp. UMB4614]
MGAPDVALDDVVDGADGPVCEAFSDADAERILTLLGAVMGAPVDQKPPWRAGSWPFILGSRRVLED